MIKSLFLQIHGDQRTMFETLDAIKKEFAVYGETVYTSNDGKNKECSVFVRQGRKLPITYSFSMFSNATTEMSTLQMDYDVIVLFVSADFLFKRPTYETWSKYLLSFVQRIQPEQNVDNFEKLAKMFLDFRRQNNFRWNSKVWVVVTNADDWLLESDWPSSRFTCSAGNRSCLMNDEASFEKFIWRFTNQTYSIEATNCCV